MRKQRHQVNNHILNSLGLTRDQVQQAFGATDEKTVIEKKNYLCATDQRRIRRRLKNYANFIIVRFKEGYKPKQIAKMLNVSEESVRSRLRQAKLFGKGNKAGRPKNLSSKQSCHPSLSVQDHAYLVHKVYLDQSQEMLG